MTFRRRLRAAWLSLVLACAALPAFGQVTWNYTFQPNGQALATYLGDVQINGTCLAGCSGISLSAPNTWTATQTFLGSATTLSHISDNMGEVVTITAAAPAATQNYDVLTQSVQYFTTNAANNWTLNIRGSAGTSLNSALAVGQALTIVVVSTQGASPFFNNALQVDGGAVTPKWQGGVAPSAGNASGLDVYTYTVIKTAAATFTVLASLAQFK